MAAEQKFEFVEKRDKQNILESLDVLVRDWFFSRFEDFSDAQLYGVLPIFERKNILVSAPTGGTKTLTAFLSILNYLVSLARKNELEERVYAVYCSPLKALSNDIHFNLLKPLKEIKELAESDPEKYGDLQEIRVGLRTGDTSASDRSKMLKKPPQILVTTPESLAIMINSPKFSEKFYFVEWLIVDEIHNLAENKRGVHFSLTIERLQEISKIPISRIGLSATIAPLEKIAHFLVGNKFNGKSEPRQCQIANVGLKKKLDLEVLSPVNDFLNTTGENLHNSLYELIDEMLEKNKTTLIFTNTRAATERVVHNLKEKFPVKFEIEEKLRGGKLKVVVCSTSLELGIDIGFIDLVLLLGSPKSVSRAMQRIGRAGHQLHETARGKFIVYDFDDLVESSVILKNAKENKIDKVHIPENSLDVLSQHIYGMAIYKVWKVDEMFNLIRSSYCFRNLKKEDFLAVVSYLTGEYELEKNNVYAKIWYDSKTREIGKRGKLARVIYMTNIGTIPDESFVNVVLQRGRENVGKLDEGFLERMRKGDVFVLGGSKYEFLYVKGMKVYVKPSLKKPTIPSWFSEVLPLSFDAAMSIQKFRKLLNEKFESLAKEENSPHEVKEFIKKYVYCDDKLAEIIFNYFEKQFKYSLVPHENKIVVEFFQENLEKGKKNFIIFHSLFGRRVNDALSRAVAYVVASARKRDVEIGISDNGFYLSGKDLNVEKVEKGFKLIVKEKEKFREILEEAIEKTEVLKRRFRHAAARGLMILRNYKGRIKSVGKQQMSSHFLFSAVKKKTKNFPILKEAKREVLEDLMNIENAGWVLDEISKGKIKIEKAKGRAGQKGLVSPFAINLVLQAHADVIKIEDKVEFIKRIYKELENI